MPPPHLDRGHTGKFQIRATTQRGRVWWERWNLLSARDVDAMALLAFVRRAAQRGVIFDIEHLETPGSGLSPLGLGTAGVLVKGASQTGDSIVTDGWPVSTSNVARAGDHVKIAGLNDLFEIYEDASSDGTGTATLKINPPIPSGSAPADNAAVTTTGAKLRAIIVDVPSFGEVRSVHFYDNFEAWFAEAI